MSYFGGTNKQKQKYKDAGCLSYQCWVSHPQGHTTLGFFQFLLPLSCSVWSSRTCLLSQGPVLLASEWGTALGEISGPGQRRPRPSQRRASSPCPLGLPGPELSLQKSETKLFKLSDSQMMLGQSRDLSGPFSSQKAGLVVRAEGL